MKNLIVILIVLMVGGMSVVSHAQETKTSALLQSSNDEYDHVNSFLNANSAELTASVGDLPYPVESVSGTDAQKRTRLLNAVKVLVAWLNDPTIGKDRGYWTTLQAAGYTTPTEAYQDIPNRFTGTTKTHLQTNLSTGNTAWTNSAAILLDNNFLVPLLNAVKGIQQEHGGIVNGLSHE